MVQIEGKREIARVVPHFNLDAVISVGYRVNSKQGVKFRQRATKTLNDHLTYGFTLNAERLAARGAELGLAEARDALDLLSQTLLANDNLSADSKSVLALVTGYSKTWTTLLHYDEDRLTIPAGTPSTKDLDYAAVMVDVNQMKGALMDKGKATPLFGAERGPAFEGLLGSFDQTMFGDPLYKSREEKAANLMYFIIKDHPFSDGNKRIGSFMFMRYMQQQGMEMNITPDNLTALALLIAESDPANKDLMARLTMNTISAHTNALAPSPSAQVEEPARPAVEPTSRRMRP